MQVIAVTLLAVILGIISTLAIFIHRLFIAKKCGSVESDEKQVFVHYGA
jgi:hypothetical protein